MSGNYFIRTHTMRLRQKHVKKKFQNEIKKNCTKNCRKTFTLRQEVEQLQSKTD